MTAEHLKLPPVENHGVGGDQGLGGETPPKTPGPNPLRRGRPVPRPDTRPARASPPAQRPRVDGKFLARGASRVRVNGVTYGPFAPGADGRPFPTPDQAAADFEAMR